MAVRARDALRARLTEMLRLLADLARSGTRGKIPSAIDNDVDSWRRRISQKVQEIQTLMSRPSLSREPWNLTRSRNYRRCADLFVLLLSLARNLAIPPVSDAMRATAIDLDNAVATALEALATIYPVARNRRCRILTIAEYF